MLSGSHAYAAADIYAAHLEVTESAGGVVAFTVPFNVAVAALLLFRQEHSKSIRTYTECRLSNLLFGTLYKTP